MRHRSFPWRAPWRWAVRRAPSSTNRASLGCSTPRSMGVESSPMHRSKTTPSRTLTPRSNPTVHSESEIRARRIVTVSPEPAFSTSTMQVDTARFEIACRRPAKAVLPIRFAVGAAASCRPCVLPVVHRLSRAVRAIDAVTSTRQREITACRSIPRPAIEAPFGRGGGLVDFPEGLSGLRHRKSWRRDPTARRIDGRTSGGRHLRRAYSWLLVHRPSLSTKQS